MSQTDVTVDITQNTAAISEPGFGTPMILGYSATFPERVRTYTDSDGIAVDFAKDTPESIAANAILAQDSHPPQVKIGRGVLPPTMVYAIGVATVRNSHAYLIEVFGTGVAFTALAPASDSSATNDEIVDAIVTALNGVPARNYTAAATGSNGSHVATVTGNVAGAWFSLRVVDPTDLSCKLTHADPGIATDLDNINKVDSDWFALGTFFNSKLCVLATSQWAATNERLYAWDSPETDIIATATGAGAGGDSVEASKASSYRNAGGFFYDDPSKMLAMAFYGAFLGFDPGQVNPKFRTLVGVPVLTTLTDTHRVNLKAKFGNSYETRFGRGCTFEGYTADGNYFDTYRNREWLKQTMIVNVAQPLFDNPNVPLNDGGILLFVGKMKLVLGMAVDQNVALDDPAPTVKYPKASAISSADRQSKTLRNLQFFATQASGVNTVLIKGSILF